jgi:hypothetical protein
MVWWWILGGLAALFIGGLALAAVLNWFNDRKVTTSGWGDLVKQRMASGNYRVIGGIFDKRGVRTATQVWETEELDDDLKSYFGNRNQVRVEL